MNRTPRFPGDVKPVRPGVYERQWLVTVAIGYSQVVFSYWDGYQWFAPARTPERAEIVTTAIHLAAFAQPDASDAAVATRWRGLLNEFLPI